MPAARVLLKRDRFARKVAWTLNPSRPESIAVLRRTLKCTAQALMRASEDLALMGVRLTLSDAGWKVDPASWKRCQTIADTYEADLDAVRGRRAK